MPACRPEAAGWIVRIRETIYTHTSSLSLRACLSSLVFVFLRSSAEQAGVARSSLGGLRVVGLIAQSASTGSRGGSGWSVGVEVPWPLLVAG